MKKSEMHVNDIVYTNYSSVGIVKAKIIDIGEEHTKLSGIKICDKYGFSFPGSFGAMNTNIFKTESEAREAAEQALEDVKNGYREEIKTIADLVRFCLDYCVASADEYTDWAARDVAIEKAEEFGIHIS